MAETDIEWTATVNEDGSVTPGATWNPVRGCSKVSPGCTHCYAERQAARFCGPGMPYEGLVRIPREDVVRISKGAPRWTGEVRLIEDKLSEPASWRKPRRIFVNSMSDLFHEKLTNEDIARVFTAMRAAPQHTYQVLTKRTGRAVAWFQWLATYAGVQTHICHLRDALHSHGHLGERIHIGASVEDQKAADLRILELAMVPAAVRFLSCEPLLGPVNIGLAGILPKDVRRAYTPVRTVIHWVIVGGESGPGARPCCVSWIRAIVEECRENDTPVFVKQLGALPVDTERRSGVYAPDDKRSIRAQKALGLAHDSAAPNLVLLKSRKGKEPSEWPEDLRVRAFPKEV